MPSCLRTIILFLHVASGMKNVDTPGLVQRCPSHSTFISPVNKTPEYLNSAVCSVLYNSQLCGFSAICAGVRHQRYNLTLHTVLLLITLTWPNISVLFVLGRLHYSIWSRCAVNLLLPAAVYLVFLVQLCCFVMSMNFYLLWLCIFTELCIHVLCVQSDFKFFSFVFISINMFVASFWIGIWFLSN